MKTPSTEIKMPPLESPPLVQGSSNSKMGRTPTLKEFADAIGVSPTTVSRSITRRGRVSEETREMVLKRIQELGYTPNLHAQRLVTGCSYTVAVCIGGGLAPSPNPFLVGLIRGLQQALQEYNYGLLILGTDGMLKRWVDSKAVDGVIIVGGSEENAEGITEVVKESVPCIFVGTIPIKEGAGVGSVINDTAGSAVKVANLLVRQGHKKIGFIGSSHTQIVGPTFKDELTRLGVAPREEWFITAGDTPDDGEVAMRQLLALKDRPTAVFTRTDELAIGALRAARKARVAVPEELSIIGHDDLDLARYSEPPLSSVRINCDTVGKAVVTLLFDLMAQPEQVFESRYVETELVLRETVAAAP